ncbi:MAG: ABC transporter substrate-binding protein [Proteobacteria bacterium]|jgi:phospholipid transport system substrate-binding protein|nr:ABC transporter substrate-binding protein [Pseudomonadota bacterium]
MKKILLTIIYTLVSTFAIASESDINSKQKPIAQNNKLSSSSSASTKSVIPATSNMNQDGSVIATISCEINTPCYLVKDTSDRVITVINNDSSSRQSTLLIKTIVTPQFDFTLMTRYALGNNWKNATETQQAQLVDNFKQLLLFTYTAALSKFKGAKITITSESINDKKAAVISQVILPNSGEDTQPIKVEYDLAKTGDNQTWKAYDIKIENASLVTTYRNQFNEIIQTSKIDGLINQLKAKVASLQKRK